MKNKIFLLLFLPVILLGSQLSFSHCQVPCGIYEDSLRIEYINEHITTIEKAMNQINTLSKESKPNYNQLVRWVNTKEAHANKIQEIVSQYFLHQRIKIVGATDAHYTKYVRQLELLHQISVYAMKTKQTTDLENITKLRKAVTDFSASYFHTHDHSDWHKH